MSVERRRLLVRQARHDYRERAAADGAAAYADIDSGLAIAVMRNHILGGFSTVTAIDDLVTDHYR